MTVDTIQAQAVHTALTTLGKVVTIGDLERNPRERKRRLPVIPLLMNHQDSLILLPSRHCERRLVQAKRIPTCEHGNDEVIDASNA
jgi:hypothetical protein